MDAERLGIELRARRLRAGLTQQALAGRMATNQPAVARVEAGRVLPALPFIERWMLATGSTLTLPLDAGPKRLSARAKGQLARQATKPPDPWARLEEKRRRGLDTEVEERYLRSMRVPTRSRRSVSQDS
jgi:transcriptional regulator with XRE-family HTH domain